jgi:hypothetical protein
MDTANHIPMTRMDRDGDRYMRANGKWAKISKQPKGGYTVVRGWKGELQADPLHGKTINHRTLDWARRSAESWVTGR